MTLWWMQRFAAIIGLKVRVAGTLRPDTVLLTANHVSWIDIVAIATFYPANFVAKSSVQSWPLIGTISSLGGTLFVHRDGSKEKLKNSIANITDVLRRGRSVVVFPEGTTTDGKSVGHFHNALFQPAIDAGCPIQPMVICYTREGELDTIAPFIGDDTFIAHLLRIFRTDETEVTLTLRPAIPVEGKTRSELTNLCQKSIGETLQSYLANQRGDDF